MSKEDKIMIREYMEAAGIKNLPKDERFGIARALIFWVTQPNFKETKVLFPFLGTTIEEKLTTFPINKT